MAMLLQQKPEGAGIKLVIAKQRIMIGRDPANDISIDDDLVSKEHAVLEVALSQSDESKLEYYLQDLDSTNHTYVNDERITLFRLNNGDMIRIGMTNFRFVDEENGNLEETAKLHKTWIPGLYLKKGKK
ncbi:MAG: FHA domain-containing protein [Proteobacteria bacterium]|jgi:pSer/pThr/pTyr-binding forkhead associated (FHA) protein|nr:FHA domain-containing protein [Pseudomonadota bacterium]